MNRFRDPADQLDAILRVFLRDHRLPRRVDGKIIIPAMRDGMPAPRESIEIGPEGILVQPLLDGHLVENIFVAHDAKLFLDIPGALEGTLLEIAAECLLHPLQKIILPRGLEQIIVLEEFLDLFGEGRRQARIPRRQDGPRPEDHVVANEGVERRDGEDDRGPVGVGRSYRERIAASRSGTARIFAVRPVM